LPLTNPRKKLAIPFGDHKNYIDSVKENSSVQNLERDNTSMLDIFPGHKNSKGSLSKTNRSYFGDDILDSYVENIKKDIRVFDDGAQGKRLRITAKNQFNIIGPSTAR
jgi:hypothetical protein